MPPLTPAAAVARNALNCECQQKLRRNDSNKIDSNESSTSTTILIISITVVHKMFYKPILNNKSGADDQKEAIE